MKTWFRYSVAFFSFVVLLTVFIVAIGPVSYRQALREGGQKFRIQRAHEFVNPGMTEPSNR